MYVGPVYLHIVAFSIFVSPAHKLQVFAGDSGDS